MRFGACGVFCAVVVNGAAMFPSGNLLNRLVASILGDERSDYILRSLAVAPRLLVSGVVASRAQIAMALNAVLFSELLVRVPTAAEYVARSIGEGHTVRFDHGALRTIDGFTGAMPSGNASFARILEPLGELERDALGSLARGGHCPLELAVAALPGLVGTFGRNHSTPALADYEMLLAHSPEAAWIATEGNAFNHATDRVPDVMALAAELQERGMPLNPQVEVSANGRVRQTAFLADKVLRKFRLGDGSLIEREVPGSFYEFISRDIDPATGRIDLSFDSGNATGIFAVTSAQ